MVDGTSFIKIFTLIAKKKQHLSCGPAAWSRTRSSSSNRKAEDNNMPIYICFHEKNKLHTKISGGLTATLIDQHKTCCFRGQFESPDCQSVVPTASNITHWGGRTSKLWEQWWENSDEPQNCGEPQINYVPPGLVSTWSTPWPISPHKPAPTQLDATQAQLHQGCCKTTTGSHRWARTLQETR